VGLSDGSFDVAFEMPQVHHLVRRLLLEFVLLRDSSFYFSDFAQIVYLSAYLSVEVLHRADPTIQFFFFERVAREMVEGWPCFLFFWDLDDVVSSRTWCV
jgi:hypothetical protein